MKQDYFLLCVFGFLFMFGTILCNHPVDAAEKPKAYNLHLLELDRFSLEYYQIKDLREPYFPNIGMNESSDKPEYWSYGAATLFDLTVLQLGPASLFWRNNVAMDATNKQVRHVGWLWELGFPITEKLDIFYRHHSEHYMDDNNPLQRFPVRDEYVVRLNFYQRKK